MLEKEGGSVKTWKTRWFVLNQAGLHYYKTRKVWWMLGFLPKSFDLCSPQLGGPPLLPLGRQAHRDD